jgi:hypothetical protein
LILTSAGYTFRVNIHLKSLGNGDQWSFSLDRGSHGARHPQRVYRGSARRTMLLPVRWFPVLSKDAVNKITNHHILA